MKHKFILLPVLVLVIAVVIAVLVAFAFTGISVSHFSDAIEGLEINGIKPECNTLKPTSSEYYIQGKIICLYDEDSSVITAFTSDAIAADALESFKSQDNITVSQVSVFGETIDKIQLSLQEGANSTIYNAYMWAHNNFYFVLGDTDGDSYQQIAEAIIGVYS